MIHEPTTNTKADGTEGSMSIEIDLDTKDTPEVTPEGTPEAAGNPASLEIAQPAPADRPAWLDPRFKSPEELQESYRQLESRLGQPKQADEKSPAKVPEAPPAQPAGLTEPELEAYSREVTSTGDLSPASYAALAAKGLPKSLVQSHVAGLLAQKDRVMADALKPFGGPEGYKAASEWARANMSPAEQAQYNQDVKSGDPARVMYAVNGLQARHLAAVGQGAQPRLVHGRRGGSQSGPGFSSMDQQVAAMQDPRYGHDRAYTNEVIEMVKRSTGY